MKVVSDILFYVAQGFFSATFSGISISGVVIRKTAKNN